MENSKGKQIKFNADAITKVRSGVEQLANAVKVTLGPKGKNVALCSSFGQAPFVTKDGVSVAREIFFEDSFENAGAQIVKEVAQKTADKAGDGTTTATILAESIFKNGLKATANGANPMFLKRGIELAAKRAVAEIRGYSQQVTAESLKAVATISANNDDELGALISRAMDKAGVDGVITVEESKSFDTSIDSVEGMEIPRGYLSPYFINNPDALTCDLEKPRILVVPKDITNVKTIVPVLEEVAREGSPLLIIAQNVDGSALNTLIMNKMQGRLKVCAIKAPYFGDNQLEMLKDICAVTGATLISEELGVGLDGVRLQELGTAEKVAITKEATIISNGGGDPDNIKERIQVTRKSLENIESDFDKEKAQERLAKLSDGVIVLYVGAATETEMKDKKARIEDALHATRAAVEQGIVPGGGVTYLRAGNFLSNVLEENPDGPQYESIREGIKIVQDALYTPFDQICTNAGLTSAVIRERIQRNQEAIGVNTCYDIVTDTVDDALKLGVIDPTKVAVEALMNAASAAGMLLTLDAVIADIPDDNEGDPTPRQPNLPYYGGGM